MKSPVRLVLVYALLSGLWIAFSDRLLLALVSESEVLTRLQSAKGFLFVAVNALLVYWLATRAQLTGSLGSRPSPWCGGGSLWRSPFSPAWPSGRR